MLAAYAAGVNADDPLAALEVGDFDPPPAPDGWVEVRVRAASLNHHDLWALRGVALAADRVPMVLGTDAAGVAPDGSEVVIHAVIGDPVRFPDETLDPSRTLLSELHQGTLAEIVRVPARNLLPKPAALTFEQAACLPTAWLTAYRMIATQSGTSEGDTLLIQGAAGGVASAAIVLGQALGRRVWVTSRDEAKRAWAIEQGADAAFEPGAKLPERVDAVIETVGQATMEHSLRALRPGGTVVVSGATSGAIVPVDLRRIFFLQLRIIGSTMGTREEFVELLALLDRTDARPSIDRVLPLARAREGLAAMEEGNLRGKIVLTSG